MFGETTERIVRPIEAGIPLKADQAGSGSRHRPRTEVFTVRTEVLRPRSEVLRPPIEVLRVRVEVLPLRTSDLLVFAK